MVNCGGDIVCVGELCIREYKSNSIEDVNCIV